MLLLLLLLWLAGCGTATPVAIVPTDGIVVEATVPSPAAVCVLTPPDQEGPFYIADAPQRANLYPEGTAGTPLRVSGTVYNAACRQRLAGAVVEAWQADDSGNYDFSAQFLGRATIIADENGRYEFTTIFPGQYEPRPPHIHLRISHPDAATLVTQMYFAGEANSGLPAALITTTSAADEGGLQATFDLVLGG